MIIDYAKVTWDSQYEEIKATVDALNNLTTETLDRYVSDERLNAMIKWLASYYHFIGAGCRSLDELGWYHDTVKEDRRWARERYETLARYRRQNR